MNQVTVQALGRAGGPDARSWRGSLDRVENLLVTMALLAMVLLPLLEISLRKTLHIGIQGSASLVQHLTLVTSMLGGAIAAREGRLLSLSSLASFLKGGWGSAARIFSASLSSALAAVLSGASCRYAVIEMSNPAILVYGVPVWVAKFVLPAGFAAIALRLLVHAGKTARAKAAAALLAAAWVSIGAWSPIPPETLLVPALLALLAATLLGAPIFVTLGGAAVILFHGTGGVVASMSVEHYDLVVNPSLPALPLFTLAGYLLAEGGAAARLIRVFRALVGRFRGGPAIATVLVCAFFTSFTGASGVTILALGGLLMPVLIAAQYSERNALGLLTGSGSIGLLLPPCLPIILYAIVARVEIKDVFLGGLIPAGVLIAGAAGLGVFQNAGREATVPGFDWTEARKAVGAAKWELLMPVVALVPFLAGWADPVEAAALTAFYAIVIEALVYHDLSLTKGLARAVTECGLIIGGVLLILGVAKGLAYFLVDAQVPDTLLNWATSSIESPLLFLLILNFMLLIVGCLMDIYSAIVVVVPLVVPIGVHFGIDPVHLGIVFLANLELGYLTPPIGMNLFLSSYRFSRPMAEVTRSILPMFLVLILGVLLITYVPPLSTALPRIFGTAATP